jgi:poly(3-hydroxybutyrate) depolymerase
MSCSRVRLCLALLLVAVPAHAQKTTTHQVTIAGSARTYRMLSVTPGSTEPAPLIILLHGSGRDGSSQLSQWEKLGRDQRIVLVAPDSLDRQGWGLGDDGPDFLQAIVEDVKKAAPVDDRRVYIFGHSAGGHHALVMGLLESEYFAAIAVHAGTLNQSQRVFLDQARRPIPFGFWQGTNDRIVPVAAVRATRDVLQQLKFPVLYNEIQNHSHDYYSRADSINKEAWAFLKQHALTAAPVFQRYQFGR